MRSGRRRRLYCIENLTILLLTLAAIVTALGQVVGKKEGWSRFDGLYWSFIAATTVGYGDYLNSCPPRSS